MRAIKITQSFVPLKFLPCDVFLHQFAPQQRVSMINISKYCQGSFPNFASNIKRILLN